MSGRVENRLCFTLFPEKELSNTSSCFLSSENFQEHSSDIPTSKMGRQWTPHKKTSDDSHRISLLI